MASKCDSGRGQGDGCPRVRQGRRDAGGSRCSGWGLGQLVVSPAGWWHFVRGWGVPGCGESPAEPGRAGRGQLCPATLAAQALSQCPNSCRSSLGVCQPRAVPAPSSLPPAVSAPVPVPSQQLRGPVPVPPPAPGHASPADTPGRCEGHVAAQLGCHNLRHPAVPARAGQW